jgi:hypothetical protein
MKRQEFEIKAAEFFFCGDDVEEQYNKLKKLDNYIYPSGINNIIVWEPFIDYDVSTLLMFIENLADNYEEFYNMTNERFRKTTK